MKKIISILVCVAILASLSSCAFARDFFDMSVNVVEKEKSFEYEDFSIMLTTSFLTVDFISEEYSFIWGDGDVTVMGLEVDLEGVSAEDYAVAFAENLGYADGECVGELDGIPTIEYEAENDGELFRYLVFVYESADGFWVVIMGSEEDIYEEQYENICKYARSVQISK